MKTIDQVLEEANALIERGLPLPLDLLARADELGIMVSSLDQPNDHTQTETE